MRTIYNYKDIRKLNESTISDRLTTGIILSATKEMAEGLMNRYPEYLVLDIHEIEAELLPEWKRDAANIVNYVALRDSLDKYARGRTNEKLIMSMKRNSTNIWNTIKLLVEADVYPDDISDDNKEPVLHFRNLWKQFEVDNPLFLYFRSQFLFKLSNPVFIERALENILSQKYEKKFDLSLINRLFCIGFYFITPIQMRLIEILEKSGMEISYLNCYDSNYPNSCEIWAQTFRDEYESGCFEDIQPDIFMGNIFGCRLEKQEIALSLNISRFSSEMDFAKGMRGAVETDSPVFSTNPKASEKILMEYYPDRFLNKHLLSYPVGQFIYALHQSYNPISGNIELEYENVYKAFASGWLATGALNGKDYILVLKKLRTYLGDTRIKTGDEWVARLREIKNSIYTMYRENQGLPGDTENIRWHRLANNPYVSLGVFQINVDDIDAIINLIVQFVTDASALFDIGSKTNIKNHFEKITHIIQDRLSTEDTLESEKAIANELIKNLKEAGTKALECPLDAVRDAVMLLVDGRMNEYEDFDEEIENTDRLTKAFALVEAAMLCPEEKDIYLVLADEVSLPGKIRPLPWPLTDELLLSIKKKRPGISSYVDAMRNIINNRPKSYRYLFYSLWSNTERISFDRIHISWIENSNGKSLGVSPYLLLLDEDANDIMPTVSQLDLTPIGNRAYPGCMVNITNPDRELLPPEVIQDYLLCDKRYMYSYILNKYPEYISDFHCSFFHSRMMNYFRHVKGWRWTQAANRLAEMMPFYNDVLTAQSRDYSGKLQDTPVIMDNYQGREYPTDRLDAHYLNKAVRDYAKKLYDGETPDELSVDKCTYCPFVSDCIWRPEERLKGER